MNNEQIPCQNAITRIVMEKIPKAKRWPVSKEFKSWIDSLSKEQFQVYLDRLRLLIRTLSDQESALTSTRQARSSFLGLIPPPKSRSSRSLLGLAERRLLSSVGPLEKPFSSKNCARIKSNESELRVQHLAFKLQHYCPC
jgi:hypothetical protein